MSNIPHIDTNAVRAMVPAVFHDLFNSKGENLVRHWEFISNIASGAGFEKWWQCGLLGHLQRRRHLPSVSPKLVAMMEQEHIDLAISNAFPPSRGLFIPMELKLLRDEINAANYDRMVQYIVGDMVGLARGKKLYPPNPAAYFGLLVTGLRQPNRYRMMVGDARNLFDRDELRSLHLKCVLDEEIQILRDDGAYAEIGEETSWYDRKALAHQFVWEITP